MMNTEFDIDKYLSQLQESRSIDSCEWPPLPEVDDDQTYVFICYSRQDYKKVFEDLAYLYKNGVRFKYDRELKQKGSPDRSWIEDVTSKYIIDQNCAGVVFFYSSNLFTSRSIIEEITSIDKNKKKYLCVALTDEQPMAVFSRTLPSMEKSGMGTSDVAVLAKTFNDQVTYLKYHERDHVKDFIERLKNLFDVVDVPKKMDDSSAFQSCADDDKAAAAQNRAGKDRKHQRSETRNTYISPGRCVFAAIMFTILTGILFSWLAGQYPERFDGLNKDAIIWIFSAAMGSDLLIGLILSPRLFSAVEHNLHWNNLLPGFLTAAVITFGAGSLISVGIVSFLSVATHLALGIRTDFMLSIILAVTWLLPALKRLILP